jgi:hypothetical protein
MLPELRELTKELLDGLAEIRDPGAVLRVMEARRNGVHWDKISEADRAKYRRADPAVRKVVAREKIWRGLLTSRYPRDASEAIYEQRYYTNYRLLRTYTHVLDTSDKLELFREVMSDEWPSAKHKHWRD